MCTVIATQGGTFTPSMLEAALASTTSRGPDGQRVVQAGSCNLGFQRLSIMGLSETGMQPFRLNGNIAVCNGEIYGFRKIKEQLEKEGYTFQSGSDCEILLPLYEKYGTESFVKLDAEYACILYDQKEDKLIAARDPIGIRPLYYGYGHGGIAFASEPKNLTGLVDKILPFPPGHYWKDGQFVSYTDISKPEQMVSTDVETACSRIHDLLEAAVEKRLDADAPAGYLLSGGLDSSLVCAIAQKHSEKPIRTFAIGMETDAIDLKYAKEAADWIGSDHTEFVMTQEEVNAALPEVIKTLATWDITTIRASMGMYLLCKKIREATDVRVLLTGEVSDELFGYKYTDFAPDAEAFQAEAAKRVHELHMYDVLRADRCISVHSMEARVPFGDLDFARYVMALDPELKLNTYGKGKYLLRHAFEGTGLLPDALLMREKAAFSDAVGHSMADGLKEMANKRYTNAEFAERVKLYPHGTPFTKESLMYRDIFEQYYPGQAEMIGAFWMPNETWPGCDVKDPSARYLANYGSSGS